MASRRRSRKPTPAGTAGVAVGAAAGTTTLSAGSAAIVMAGVAISTAAAARVVSGTVRAVMSTLRRIAALRLVRERQALQKAGFAEDVITVAMNREVELETIFQRRSKERLEVALRLAARAPDTSARTAAIASAVRRERTYARQRALASGGRLFSSIERTTLEEQSPLGAYWKLGIAAEHTPDCVAMAEKFWPWEVLRKIHPLLHVGCKCKLYSYGEAIAAGWMTPADIMSLAKARELAAPVIDWVEQHHAQENAALAELMIREELIVRSGVDRNYLACAPLATDEALYASVAVAEETEEDDEPGKEDE